MTYPIGKAKGKTSLLEHGAKLQEISDDYFLREKYQILHEGILIEEQEKYKYTTPQLLEKYGIRSYNVLSFLIMTLKKVSGGLCEYCGNEYFEWPMRNGSKSTYCGCIANCHNCKTPFARGYGHFQGLLAIPKCNTCCRIEHEQSREPQKPPTQEEIEQHWINDSDDILWRWSNIQIAQECSSEQIEFIVNILTKKIKSLNRIKELMGEDNE